MGKSDHRRRASDRGRATPPVPSGIEESAGHRHARLQELIREEIVALLRDEVRDPLLEPVRVTSVVLSVDYRHARVHFARLRPSQEPAAVLHDVQLALLRATPFLRARLAESLDLKRVPDLRFVFDAEVPREGDPCPD